MDGTGGIKIHYAKNTDCTNCEDGVLWPVQEGGREGLIRLECGCCGSAISQYADTR